MSQTRFKIAGLVLVSVLIGIGALAGRATTKSRHSGPEGVGDVLDDWVRISGGTFTMGGTLGDDDQLPAHEVTVPSFEMWRTEVTVAQYRACVEAGVCPEPGWGQAFANWNEPLRDDHPVNLVNWYDSRTFCSWIGARLPTEAEWEFAARGVEGRTYPWGEEHPTCDRVVMDAGGAPGCGESSSWQVCSKPAGNTPQGLCDMGGNLLEWIEDPYHDSYVGAPTDGSAWDDIGGEIGTVRGGAFTDSACGQLADGRIFDDRTGHCAFVGFRCARK